MHFVYQQMLLYVVLPLATTYFPEVKKIFLYQLYHYIYKVYRYL